MKNQTLRLSIPLFPIVFVLAILKLAGILNVSWLWITAPLWIPFALFVAFAMLFLLLALIFGVTVTKKGK